MSVIKATYKELCTTISDINEHLPTLRAYSTECMTITECGVRSAISSYAFADGLRFKKTGKLIMIDIKGSESVTKFLETCKAENIDATFHQADDLTSPIEDTDLLFIDTWHVYGQLKRELARWHTYTKKYIILHDTTVDADKGETIRTGWNAKEQSAKTGIPVEEINKGLWPAIEEFLAANPEWIMKERFTNNNGLTVLQRV